MSMSFIYQTYVSVLDGGCAQGALVVRRVFV